MTTVLVAVHGIKLQGKLSWDRPVLLPAAESWKGWVAETMGEVDPLLPVAKPNDAVVESWLGEPEARFLLEQHG